MVNHAGAGMQLIGFMILGLAFLLDCWIDLCYKQPAMVDTLIGHASHG